MHGFFVVVHADSGQGRVEIDFFIIRSGRDGFFKRVQGFLILALRQQYIPQAEAGLGIGRIKRERRRKILDRRIDKTQKMLKADKKYQAELDFFKRVREALDAGKSARSVECTPEEAELLSTVSLLTNKPVIYAANMTESDFKDGVENNPYFQAVKKIADEEHAAVLPISAEIEAEISGLEPEEKELFLADMGLSESGLDRLINACYSLLGLISYLTAGQPEVRAWTIKKGTKAPQAAGKIHSDFERGFIRAEVIAFDDLMACGSMTAAREKGLVRSEGKEYVMQDGDIVLFRFNV